MKIEYQDRIENYLFNRMSDTDRLAFEQDLEKDTELRDQYEFISMVKTALMLENIEKDVTNWSNAYKEKQRVAAVSYRPTGTDCNYCSAPPIRKECAKPYSSGRKNLYWISGIAAVLVVGVFVFNLYSPLYSTSSPESANESTLLPDNIVPNVDMSYISSPESANESTPRPDNIVPKAKGRSQMDINTLLAKGDYSKALAYIESYEEYIRMELMQHLEREVYSRGGSQEDDAGEEQDSLEKKLAQLLYWKAKALIGLNRKDEALKLLDEIRHSDSKYKEQADSLYIVLKKRR